ncbi:MAG: CopD family protein [Flavobacteriia bacterium]|nr:CopD family protein [Flavobacteriia bacterium]OIP45344.1 MAG: protoporphyrinogen IX oxidase [Flavobacteriaceae bacterium CG2_30_31_66]PIV97714.1 MAG: protoporphyrinogen IX oxidase [Flavobacteriaceae bacterium CG17_big_fil_post_rev_8_21_14_2_50_31_13]PIX13704.1 MAG: protoporphyrinogen IX oxidase [Flavobacteriaceae bacterium CG_4_8_14_3_um_filter_31_8]PIY15709.1 MAG: protoporphyrinogen IX oxidase [Flavobacteriaceae bacterium CG_4_10_14_3_um_filter_31_253]PIZ11474.1 MAG: protoporphyrinogen IX 
MDFYYVKALHIIFVITWFAGLFYIIRLFIYHVEAESKPQPDKQILQTQYKLMSKRLWYIITWPSAILASFFAFWMLYKNPDYFFMPWMHVKLAFVLALYFYHYSCQRIYSQLQNDIIKYSAFKLRIWNEVSTIILFAVIFLVTLQDAMNWIWGVVGIFVFGIVLMLGIKLYKRIREKNSWEKTK